MPALERVEKSVFISYRRTSVSWALCIYLYLTSQGFDVFFDYEGIGGGDFEQIILGNLLSRAHFLIVLTPSALECCDEPGDWLRREIESALDNKRNIVPLLFDGFSFGSAAEAGHLSGKLVTLRKYQGLELPAAYFFAALERLRTKFLSVPLSAVLHPPSATAQQAAKGQKRAAIDAPPVTEPPPVV